jgi:predicted ATPase
MTTGIQASGRQSLFHHPHYYSLVAILQARAGDIQDSLNAIRTAKQLIADSGEYFWHADVLRIEGELGLLFGGSRKEAEASFFHAIEIARKQQAKSFELRAATSLASLWRDEGNLTDARNLLGPTCGWFTEGFNTHDLKQANLLLERLS